MRTQIVADGGFGREVAAYLVTLLTSTGATAEVTDGPDGAQLAALLSAGDVAIRVSWRDVPAEFEQFAAAASAACRPWLPVALAHPHVRVGPAFVPGLGPCPTCYRVRVRQHSDVPGELSEEIDRHRVRNPTVGVAGYPPHVAALVAGQAIGMARVGFGPGGQERVGQLAEINYLTDVVRVWRVIPVHGCPQCHPETEQRAAAKLRADRLRELAGRHREGVRS